MKNYFFNCNYTLKGKSAYGWGVLKFDVYGDCDLSVAIADVIAKGINIKPAKVKNINVISFNEI